MVTDQTILLRSDDAGVPTLTLNRPGQYNSLSDAMIEALQRELDDIAADDSIQVVILAANGKGFRVQHNDARGPNMGGIGLPGGAVYIETWRLRSRSWQSAVSLAGPLANLLMAILLSVVLWFAPSGVMDKNSPWPGIAFLALLQLSALVLNLIPAPPFDGYGILEPFLNEGTRAWINSMRTFIMLAVFFALWNVPAISDMFWTQVYTIAYVLGVPFELAFEGFTRFRFWLL